MAINSLFVGFPRRLCIVYPKNEFKTSTSPLSHATSIAWRIARSTREEVVENFFATIGYKILVIDPSTSLSVTAKIIPSRK